MRSFLTARDQVAMRAPWRLANELLEDPRRVDPTYFTGIHEMAHVLDLLGQTDERGTMTRARSRLENELLDLYLRDHPDQAHLVQNTEGLRGVGPGMKSFHYWLNQQLPTSARAGSPELGTIGPMNMAEGLATAFTNVELDPEHANDVSKLMHKILIEESRPETSQMLRERMTNPYYKQTWEKDWGPYSTQVPSTVRRKVPMNEDMPILTQDAVQDTIGKYPQADQMSGLYPYHPDDSGALAFIEPTQVTENGVKVNRPKMKVPEKYMTAPPQEWDRVYDFGADKGFFPRWQSTTAGEPWPEDQIEDVMTEFDQPKKAASVQLFADPDGLGVWKVAADTIEFLPAPGSQP